MTVAENLGTSVAAASQLTDGIRFVRASRSRMWDSHGREYLDFSSGVLVLAAGHSHPRIAEAVRDQAGQLINCYAHPNDLRDLLAQRVLEKVGPPFDRALFTTTGSEAIDTSLKVARYRTGRPGVLAFSGAFHGKTLAATGIGGLRGTRELFGETIPGPVVRAPFPNAYRWSFGEPMDEVALDLARNLAETEGPEVIGAIILEPFLGAGGVVPASPAFLAGLRRLADDIGALLILDEIQSGLGRCGSWFAFHDAGIRPDIVVGAKHLGAGLPIVALCARGDVLDPLPDGVFTSTFGGNPLACAAALASLEVIEHEQLIEACRARSSEVRARLDQMVDRYAFVGDGRTAGLSCGIEVVDATNGSPDPAAASRVRGLAAREGLVVMPAAGVASNVVRFGPALSIPPDELHEGLDRLESAVCEAAGVAG